MEFALIGDVIQLVGSNSVFVNDKSMDEQLLQRIGEKDVSPASPLPGRSKNLVKGTALQIINDVYEEWSAWLDGLEKMVWKKPGVQISFMQSRLNIG